ncbi:MAG: Amuc_1100 family pilus-like protein [Verrucomicrobiota bacterium]
MSWIKENKFIAGLAGGTLLGLVLLLVVGLHGSGKYAEAQEKFTTASEEALGFEKLPLYPKIENKDAKNKALGEYRQSVESLQTAFEAFRPKEIKNISPQEFTDRLLAANTEVRKAFEDAGTIVPEPFFMGFERFRTSLAPGNSTGVLDYQLTSIKSLMLALAKSKASELKNLYRQPQPEDDGKAFTPDDSAITRAFPMEITFTGTEKSAREFLSAVAKTDSQFLVIRSLRIGNMKKDPPRASDAQFEKAAAEKPAAAGGDAAFAGGFVLPGDESAAPAAPAAEAAPKAADSSRILSQVLGTEQVQVFLRLDLLQFLPAKKLP